MGGKMINALNLIWIIPLSMFAGIAAFLFIACVVVGKLSKEEEEELLRKMGEKNDN